MMEWGGLG